MSKLSFRARALDANKSLPVYHADDIPDLSDYSSVNRVVPQMPTGMEKEEETEHHLQRAITAQQIYGEAQRLIIPTPEAIFDDSDYLQLKENTVIIPKQYVHVQAFTLEDELPEYDYDEEDELFLKKFNVNRAVRLSNVEFERLYERLEKACGNQPETLSLSAAHFVLKSADDDVIQGIYEYWQKKRGVSVDTSSGPGSLKQDKKDGGASHDPYIAFRRRVEKMQTRKNRKNDEASYEKMIKLRRDLQRACVILEMVKNREETKRNMLQTTIDICDKRYKHNDFGGELLMQCFEILRRRQSLAERRQSEHQSRTSNASIMERREHEEQLRRLEMADDMRKRHAKSHKARLPSTDTSLAIPEPQHPVIDYFSEPEDEPTGPDGRFTFKRRKGVAYKAPRYDIAGNWPWVHSMEGGTANHKYRYCYTSLSKVQKSLGFARRRRGRGGRILFDRAYSAYDAYMPHKDQVDMSQLPNGIMNNPQCARVPPWPHFKLMSQVMEERENHSLSLPAGKVKIHRSSVDDSKGQSKPLLHRSFSAQPTSKFRVHPYVSGSSTPTKPGRVPHTSAAVSNVSPAAKSERNATGSHASSDGTAASISTSAVALDSSHMNSSPGAVLQAKLLASQQRLPSTAPTTAVYQLNFPIIISNSSSTTVTAPLQNRRTTVRTENGSITSTTLSSHKSTKLAANKLSIVTPKASPGNGISTKSVVSALDALPGFNTFRSTASEMSTSATEEVK